MRRKILFALLFSLLLAALWCAVGSADSLRFVTQPESGHIDPATLKYTVSWETSAVPLRVEVMHCVYEYRESSETDLFGDPITVAVEKPVRVYTLTSNLKKSMSVGFTPKAGDKYRIYAYWGTGKDDYVSSYAFSADAELLVFTSQPASGSYNPETLKFNAIWTTSFTPVKLEIMKCTDVCQTGNWFNSHSYSYIVTEKTRVMGIGGPLHANCSYPFEPDAMADYCIRAYFSDDDYVDSEEFHATLSDLTFITQPQSGSCSPETFKYTASWKTSFTPVKVAVVRLYEENNFSYATFGTLNVSFPYVDTTYIVENILPVVGRQHSYAYNPACNAERTKVKYQLWAYYNDEDHVDSAVFEVDRSNMRFTAQPGEAQLNHTNGTASVSWQTNFTPIRAEIVHGYFTDSGVADEAVSTISQPGRRVTGHVFSAEVESYWIEAYYGPGEFDCIRSVWFNVVDPGHIFTRTPEDAILPPTQNTWEIEWRTNFTPSAVTVWRRIDSANMVKVYESSGGNSAVLDISGLDSGDFNLDISYDDNGWTNHVNHDFSMTRMAFTKSPQSCTHLPGESRTVSWATNFAPKQIKLVRVTDSGETVTSTPIGATSITADVQTAAGEDATQYRLRAWWGTGANDYVSGEPFWVFRLRFIQQPSGGRAESADKAFPVTWRTTFAPIGFDFLALRDGAYVSVGNPNMVNTRPDGSGSTSLFPYYGSRLSTTYIIRAYAFDGFHVDSAPFTIVNPVTFRVFFTLNGVAGTGFSYQDVEWGGTASRPEDPVSEGREFRGWFTEPEALNEYDFSTPVTQATILYAGWNRYFTVTFAGGVTSRGVGGSNPPDQTVLSGSAATDPYAGGADTDDYAFVGWTTDYEGEHPFDFAAPVTWHMTLYSQWRPLKCYVTIYANGCGRGELYRVRIGEPFPRPEVPVNPYYVHGGWYTEPECTHAYDFSLPVMGDLDLYNLWLEKPVLTMMYNDGTDTYNRYWVDFGAVPDPTPPTRTGYTFAGWFLDESCAEPYPADEPLYEDLTVYAGWNPIPYQVTFDSCGGSAVEAQTVGYDRRIVEPAQPVRAGYVFRGWYYDAAYNRHCSFFYYDPDTGLNNLSYFPVTGDTTLYARWEPEGVKISEANFPDSRWRNFVSNHYDTDGNGYLNVAEREAVTEIVASNSQIADFTGIGYFTNVTSVSVEHGVRSDSYTLNCLDVSQLTKLTTLYCYNCNLPSLILTNNRELVKLLCYGNGFTSLDLSQNTKLVRADIQECPNLTSLTVMGDIRTLKVHKTGLTSLDLLACPGLRAAAEEGQSGDYLNYRQYSVTVDGVRYELYVNLPEQGDTALVTDGIPIDAEHFPDAGFRAIVRNQADDNGNGFLTPDERAITFLSVRTGDIRNVEGIEYFPDLTKLTLPFSMVEEIDLSGCTHLRQINVHSNILTALDVSMLTELTRLDASINPPLNSLILGNAPITYLDVCGCDGLATLDLSGQPALLKAWMDGESTTIPDGVERTWTSDDGTLSGTIRADSGLSVARPEWIWNSEEDVIFRLPSGREFRATITSEPGPRDNMLVCSAAVTVDGVPFRQSKFMFRIGYVGVDTPDQWVASGVVLARPQNPSRMGSVFLGWYTTATGDSPYIFESIVNGPKTLYARWLTPGTENALRLPQGLTAIEEDAFSGISADAVIILPGVTSIADSAFADSNLQYVFGFPGSAAESFANAHAYLTFVPIDNEWLESH